jgi:hypothetical protein
MEKNRDMRETAEKVYLIAYIHPEEYNIYQIEKLLFGPNKTHKAYTAIKSEGFLQKGYIKRIPDKRKGRSEKTLVANIDFLISEMKNRMPLSSFDEYIMREKLDSKFFRYLVGGFESWAIQQHPFDAMDTIISIMEMFFIVAGKNESIMRFSGDIETEKQYRDKKNRIKKIVKLLEKEKPDLFESVFGKSKIPFNLLSDFFILLVIPANTCNKMRGISTLGKIYYLFNPITDAINKLNIFQMFNRQ